MQQRGLLPHVVFFLDAPPSDLFDRLSASRLAYLTTGGLPRLDADDLLQQRLEIFAQHSKPVQVYHLLFLFCVDVIGLLPRPVQEYLCVASNSKQMGAS